MDFEVEKFMISPAPQPDAASLAARSVRRKLKLEIQPRTFLIAAMALPSLQARASPSRVRRRLAYG